MDQIKDFLNISLSGFSLGHILSAIITLLLCLLVMRLVMKLAKKLVGRAHRLNERLSQIILTAIRCVLYLLTAIITAEALGINTTSLTAIMSVLTLGVTLAAEDILGNMAGGLVILSSRPFSIGDMVEVGSTEGIVREITLHHTKIETYDGHIIMQPNKELSSSRITNYSALGRRRIVHNIAASYDAPTETVKAACMEAVNATPHVLADPAPSVYLTEYGNSAIQYSVRCWATPDNFWSVYMTLNENLRAAFAKHGVEMTYDHLNVHIVENVK